MTKEGYEERHTIAYGSLKHVSEKKRECSIERSQKIGLNFHDHQSEEWGRSLVRNWKDDNTSIQKNRELDKSMTKLRICI